MKKKFFMGISVILLLTLLIFTSPGKAVGPTTFAGHNFSEEYFAIEVDLVGEGTSVFDRDPEHPDLIRDLNDSSAVTGDSNELEDVQFYLAYMNQSGIETAFSALEKFEHVITIGDLVKSGIYDSIHTLVPGLRPALETPISHVNATAPFQQLVQHYTSSEDTGYKDVFVTNNFMGLIAYSADSGDDLELMDENDFLYLGYTFVVQNLTDAINEVLVSNGHGADQIGHFDYKSSFTKTNTGFEFGINYTNMFVLWQQIDIAPKGIDVFGSEYIKDSTGGIVFGGEIAAATVLDYISFNYVFETEEFTGANTYIEGRVTTEYDIGETNFLITQDDADYVADGIAAGNFTHNPFNTAPSYTLTIPQPLADFNFGSVGLSIDIPVSITIDLPDLSFFVDDDAKTRIKMEDGFGLTVATATTTFGIDVVDPEYEATDDNTDVNVGGKTLFFTEFTGKKTYKLQGLEDLWGINPDTDRPAYIKTFHPDGWGVTGVAKEYFAVEFALAYGFTVFMAKELGEFMTMSDSATAYLSIVLYFTFTEFPEWYGGEIIHDPAYSAVAAMAAVGEESSTVPETSGPHTESDDTGVPGFEILATLLAIAPIYAVHRKRRR